MSAHVTVGAEAIDLIQRTAVEANQAQMLDIKGCESRYLLLGRDGTVCEQVRPPAQRAHRLGSFTDLIKFVHHVQAQEQAAPFVWVSFEGCEVICDDKTRWDRAMLPLETTHEFDLLATLSAGELRQFSQRDFIRLLRIDLAACLGADSNLVTLIRNLKQNSAGELDSEIQHGRESMGRSVTDSLRGPSVIPESVILDVRIFRQPECEHRFQIGCAIEIFPREFTFALRPFPQGLPDAVNAQLLNMQDFIHEGLAVAALGDVPVLLGRP